MKDARLALLCTKVDAEALSDRSLARIRHELPDYALVDAAEHAQAVALQHRNQLDALAEGRVISGEALGAAAVLAGRRARQGIDIEVLIGAFHLGNETLWEALTQAADADTEDVLPQAASLLFASLPALAATMASAHAEASQALHTRRITASQRLIELLLAGSVETEARAHARTLGLDAEGDFVALAWTREGAPTAVLPAGFLRRLEAMGALFAVGQFAEESLVVCQGVDPVALEHLGAQTLDRGHGGVGLVRHALHGAATSLGDARLAMTAVRAGLPGADRTMARFEEVWADACMHQDSARLAAILDPVRQVATDHRHLADAVVAFAGADMQVARAAEQLHLHPNSLSYRLDRWGKLTGWHPRTFHGLRKSLAAIGAPSRTRLVDDGRR
ncbi:CdaR family transcriptional regulator [Streptomyces sp. SID12501]|uniref:PucR family transcriptional regulator n=1 Tax=Streptomyces sp. SID12501 TaxID=2706042 RepID=A0A6B3BNH7_9ACTN|nr:PucR family transcriptional regulator [Streptomyces sp. SID12501]NEC85063.1 PucR family transcriptional regulator [Streptomyces sp. SID12501]